MGELAEKAMVSKRTIDYYTSIGLLQADRSSSNYRIYSDDALNDLKYIEECKRLHYPLDEIKRKLEMKKAKKMRDSEVEEQIQTVAQQMKQLSSELSILMPLMETLTAQQKEKLAAKLSLQGAALMESLLNLTS
ncbi:MerR family transcriptional regulator [Neobacillus sp. SM06]|uniref:MerR family transcriptional regulator n=1 Tax=Neobacillus sp. SM06 TaxID=3422492 RepID=UPI003D2AA3E0